MLLMNRAECNGSVPGPKQTLKYSIDYGEKKVLLVHSASIGGCGGSLYVQVIGQVENGC